MKKLAFLFFFAGLLISAQNNRVIYEYRYKTDSASADSLRTEWMYLDISGNGSRYYSKVAFERDSVMTESIRKQLSSGMRNVSVSRSSTGGEVSYEVEKTYPGFQTVLITSIGNDAYRVTEDRKPEWKILPEKEKVGEFTAQKATTDFAGRIWTAWFTAEIPIQDGPYKFYGLPGLIVKMADHTGTHLIELKGLKAVAERTSLELDTQGKDIPFASKKTIDVTRKQYIKLLKQHENDPVQGMREMLNRPNSKVVININGQEYTEPKDVLRMMEQNAREEMKRNNNKIELKP